MKKHSTTIKKSLISIKQQFATKPWCTTCFRHLSERERTKEQGERETNRQKERGREEKKESKKEKRRQGKEEMKKEKRTPEKAKENRFSSNRTLRSPAVTLDGHVIVPTIIHLANGMLPKLLVSASRHTIITDRFASCCSK